MDNGDSEELEAVKTHREPRCRWVGHEETDSEVDTALNSPEPTGCNKILGLGVDPRNTKALEDTLPRRHLPVQGPRVVMLRPSMSLIPMRGSLGPYTGRRDRDESGTTYQRMK